MFKTIVIVIAMLVCHTGVSDQKKQILIADYENKPATEGWWINNPGDKFLYSENPESQINKNIFSKERN